MRLSVLELKYLVSKDLEYLLWLSKTCRFLIVIHEVIQNMGEQEEIL
jgi:hypothetical protein